MTAEIPKCYLIQVLIEQFTDNNIHTITVPTDNKLHKFYIHFFRDTCSGIHPVMCPLKTDDQGFLKRAKYNSMNDNKMIPPVYDYILLFNL